METADWFKALWLDFAPMDSMNHELMALLARAQTASDEELPLAWAALVEHAVSHFGQEDAWMSDTGHARSDAHALEHRVVLNLLHEGLAQLRNGERAPVHQMARELGAWFSRHTQSLDAALALHLRRHALP